MRITRDAVDRLGAGGSAQARGEDPGPEGAFLQYARRGLTLWYTAVLVVTLLILGLILYFSQRTVVMRPSQRPYEVRPISWQATGGRHLPARVSPRSRSARRRR